VSSNPEKERETQQFGAHHFLNSRDPNALKSYTNSFDMILDTARIGIPILAHFVLAASYTWLE
jgi:alcohol/geraniol dehydrogenase (NADP+)